MGYIWSSKILKLEVNGNINPYFLVQTITFLVAPSTCPPKSLPEKSIYNNLHSSTLVLKLLPSEEFLHSNSHLKLCFYIL